LKLGSDRSPTGLSVIRSVRERRQRRSIARYGWQLGGHMDGCTPPLARRQPPRGGSRVWPRRILAPENWF